MHHQNNRNLQSVAFEPHLGDIEFFPEVADLQALTSGNTPRRSPEKKGEEKSEGVCREA
jgi:hypothetical protein